MAENTLEVSSLPKPQAWAEIEAQLTSILAVIDIDDDIAAMSTISCVVHHGFGHLWTGFYRVVGPQLLRVGPYQGSLGCLEIAFGKGVCGAAAVEKRTIVVDNVDAFPGHITCDGRSKSEIVVPVFGESGDLIAVFDVDSEHLAAFNDIDAAALQRILTWFSR